MSISVNDGDVAYLVQKLQKFLSKCLMILGAVQPKWVITADRMIIRIAIANFKVKIITMSFLRDEFVTKPIFPSEIINTTAGGEAS